MCGCGLHHTKQYRFGGTFLLTKIFWKFSPNSNSTFHPSNSASVFIISNSKISLMDFLTTILLLIIPFALACLQYLLTLKSTKLPPGPTPYPIIGNLFQLLSSTKPYKALSNLSKKYGPIMTIKLGINTTIVISSPEMAKEVLQKYDHVFSSKTIPDSSKALGHHNFSIIWMPVTPQWKTLRKICATKIFSSHQLDFSEGIRRKKVRELVEYVKERCEKQEAIDIGEAVFTTVLNSITNTLFSVDFAGYGSDLTREIKDLSVDIGLEAGRPNIADYFPFLSVFDLQGGRRRMGRHLKKLFKIFDCIVEERMQKEDSVEGSDVLGSILSLMKKQNSDITRHDLLHFVLDIFLAGVDTTSSTVEWAMTELLRNPDKMAKAKKELQQALTKDKDEPKESDISKFPYLQAIVKETFRLHPLAPILLRKSNANVDICGFRIPKDAGIFINVWAIGRDSCIWTNPNLFLPERFIDSEIGFRGNYFELIPFGAGRRICPGLPLANRAVHTMLATLLYHFNWELADGKKPEDIDMSESYGITLHLGQPLMVIAIKE